MNSNDIVVVKYKVSDKDNFALTYNKDEAFELRFLVKKAVKSFINKLEDMIPGRGDFFSNFKVFSFDNIQSIDQQNLNKYGNVEIPKLAL